MEEAADVAEIMVVAVYVGAVVWALVVLGLTVMEIIKKVKGMGGGNGV